jgi:hypothetical protein
MENYEEIKKFLMMQKNSDEVLNCIKLIYENETCLASMVLNAYHLGVVTGKKAERDRRAHR